MTDMNRRHETELRAMQQKIHMNTDAAFNKFKEAAQQIMQQKLAQPITNKQVLCKKQKQNEGYQCQETKLSLYVRKPTMGSD